MKAQLMTILFAVSLATTVRAQDVLTLDAAVGIALDNNQMLRGADHARESANWGKLNAYTNFLPKVSLNSSVTQIDRATEQQANAALDFIRSAAGPLGIPPSALADLKPFAYHNTFSTAVTVVQPIYNGGAEIVGVQAADATHEKSQFSFEDAQQDVIARVKSSYLNVLKAQELVALAKESTDRTMRFLEMTRHREEVGMRTKTDVLRWEVQLASAQGSVINAENLLATSHLQLNEVLGVELEKEYRLETIPLTDSLAASGEQVRPPVQLASLQIPEAGTISGSSLEGHPSMKAMESNLRLAV